jgi:hypothetical protein
LHSSKPPPLAARLEKALPFRRTFRTWTLSKAVHDHVHEHVYVGRPPQRPLTKHVVVDVLVHVVVVVLGF